MEKISIGFSYPKKFKFGAFLISLWCKTQYSHTYIKFNYSDSKEAVFHAANGMVHFMSDTNFEKDNYIIEEYEILVDYAKHNRLFDRCMDLSGEVYGTMELCKIMISDIFFGLFKKTLAFSNGIGYICSELVGKLCQEEFGFSYSKPLFLLKPNDINTSLNQNNILKVR